MYIHYPALDSANLDKHYPVLYLMDGESHFDMLSQYMDYLSRWDVNVIPEMIVVGIVNKVAVKGFDYKYKHYPDETHMTAPVLALKVLRNHKILSSPSHFSTRGNSFIKLNVYAINIGVICWLVVILKFLRIGGDVFSDYFALMDHHHQGFMQRCHELAERAASEGESPVGSIVVKDGVIIGEAYEKSRQLKDITRHAETLAIIDARQRGEDPEGATLYTNVEPCILCAYVIRHHRIAEVVFVKHSGELGGTVEPFNVLTTSHFKSWGLPPITTHYKD